MFGDPAGGGVLFDGRSAEVGRAQSAYVEGQVGASSRAHRLPALWTCRQLPAPRVGPNVTVGDFDNHLDLGRVGACGKGPREIEDPDVHLVLELPGRVPRLVEPHLDGVVAWRVPPAHLGHQVEVDGEPPQLCVGGSVGGHHPLDIQRPVTVGRRPVRLDRVAQEATYSRFALREHGVQTPRALTSAGRVPDVARMPPFVERRHPAASGTDRVVDRTRGLEVVGRIDHPEHDGRVLRRAADRAEASRNRQTEHLCGDAVAEPRVDRGLSCPQCSDRLVPTEPIGVQSVEHGRHDAAATVGGEHSDEGDASGWHGSSGNADVEGEVRRHADRPVGVPRQERAVVVDDPEGRRRDLLVGEVLSENGLIDGEECSERRVAVSESLEVVANLHRHVSCLPP